MGRALVGDLERPAPLGQHQVERLADGHRALAALDPDLRERLLPGGRLEGAANVLIFGHADAASGVRNILKMKADGLEVGPILMGMGNRAHIVTPSITARGLLNIAALASTPMTSYA